MSEILNDYMNPRYSYRRNRRYPAVSVFESVEATQTIVHDARDLLTIPLHINNATEAEADALDDFYLRHNGPSQLFLFYDVRSNPVAAQEIGTGDDIEVEFQIVQIRGSNSYTRKNIKTGTLVVRVNGILQVEGSDYNANYDTGIITFSSPPTAGYSVQADFEFYLLCRFISMGEEVQNEKGFFHRTFTIKETGDE